jgi:hypothetical protein
MEKWLKYEKIIFDRRAYGFTKDPLGDEGSATPQGAYLYDWLSGIWRRGSPECF